MDFEGFEEEDDGNPKSPAPVRKTDLLTDYVDLRSPLQYIQTQKNICHQVRSHIHASY